MVDSTLSEFISVFLYLPRTKNCCRSDQIMKICHILLYSTKLHKTETQPQIVAIYLICTENLLFINEVKLFISFINEMVLCHSFFGFLIPSLISFRFIDKKKLELVRKGTNGLRVLCMFVRSLCETYSVRHIQNKIGVPKLFFLMIVAE